jgi:citrate lyase subunit beta / citryl-CoA lyase
VTGGAALDRVWLSVSLLFVPGSRPDRFGKAVAANPGIVILDLEDAVAAAAKDAARTHAASWLQNGNVAMVRINATGTEWYDADAAMVREVGCPVMLPKCEHPDQVAGLGGIVGDVPIVALIETASGILNAPEICAASGVARVAFGSIDLATQLGVDPADTTALLAARSQLVLACAAAGIAGPVDSPTLDLSDEAGWRADARRARDLGFTGKLCIHPRQVQATEQTFAPTPAELSWARDVVDSGPDAVSTVAGTMVDPPVVERARRLLARAADPTASDPPTT